MTKAEQLFLEAGYPDCYTDLNNNYLIYATEKQHGWSVIFDLEYQTFTPPICDENYAEVDMKTFKAIMAQIEELGW